MKHLHIIIKSVLLILLIGVLLVANRQAKAVSNRSGQIRGEVSAINQKQANSKDLEAEYAKISSLSEQINALLPDRKTLPLFINSLEQLAKDHSVALKTDFSDPKTPVTNPAPATPTAKTDPKKTTTGPNMIKFKVEALGKDTDLVEFFKDLESTPYFLQVEDFEYSSPTPTQPLSSLNLSVKLYVDTNLKP